MWFWLIDLIVILDIGIALTSMTWEWVDVSKSQGEMITEWLKCKASKREHVLLEEISQVGLNLSTYKQASF